MERDSASRYLDVSSEKGRPYGQRDEPPEGCSLAVREAVMNLGRSLY